MYSEKIEALIKAALADGVLAEKEKQILFKKAQAEGIDLDEFEMVLDARLVELQKEEKEKSAKSAPKSNKFGDVRKCPACGALVPALAGSCAACGYEFSGVESSSSTQLLAKKIAEINENQSQKAANLEKKDHESIDDWKDKQWMIMNKERVLAISQAVRTFPIPNTKADMFEFITTMQSNMLSPGVYKLEAEAYFTKYNEAIIKARALYKDDSTIENLLENHNAVLKAYKQSHKKQKKFGLKPSTKSYLGFVYLILGMLLLGGILHALGV